MTIAYLANEFPSPVEPYVVDEIEEIERRGIRVVAGSVRKVHSLIGVSLPPPEIVLLPISVSTGLRAAWVCLTKFLRLAPLVARILFRGSETPFLRLKALAHTFLGACYAVRLRRHRIEHIHVHHGYFGSWVGMTAARLLGASFSLTLHGSDLLLHVSYLDMKLAACIFCSTVSEYNQRYLLLRYHAAKEKVEVNRLGVDIPPAASLRLPKKSDTRTFKLLAVGRLHRVKDHAFLVRACAQLAKQAEPFECLIAGEGPERKSLQSSIQECGLTARVRLLGHVDRERISALYDSADVVVLTSRSEGIPLVLMEAMARARIVLAPAITGIPELVISGKTGFLYRPGAMDNFLQQLLMIRTLLLAEGNRASEHHSFSNPLPWIRHAARLHVLHNFNRSKNVDRFADRLLNRIVAHRESTLNENLILQQI